MNKAFHPLSRDTIETVIVLLLLLALMIALYDVLKAFFGIFTFAIIFSVSFARPFERLVKVLNNRRTLAAVIYSVTMIILIGLPLTFLFCAFSSHIRDAGVWVNNVKENGLPPLPLWIAKLPIVGDNLETLRLQLQENPKEVIALHQTQINSFLRHLLTSGVGILGATFQFIAGIIISALFLAKGQKILVPLKATMQHLLGARSGLSLLEATAMAVKGVSIGVMGTAFIAAIISWIGLAIAGIPFSLGFAALIFFLVVIQIGPLVVWIPLVIYMLSGGHTGVAIFLVIYGIILLAVDAVVKPVLIARSGGKLPFLVLFLGVVGGVAAWGFTGMFKGAIILAVFYTVFTTWLQKKSYSHEKLSSHGL